MCDVFLMAIVNSFQQLASDSLVGHRAHCILPSRRVGLIVGLLPSLLP
jgi:hypothetical protein